MMTAVKSENMLPLTFGKERDNLFCHLLFNMITYIHLQHNLSVVIASILLVTS